MKRSRLLRQAASWLCTFWIALGANRQLSADWVTLQNGQHLRGIDLKERGKFYRFTLETGETIYLAVDDVHFVEKSPRGEKVEFRGEKILLREKIRVLSAERKALTAQRIHQVEVWAAAGKGADEARKELDGLPPQQRTRFLSLALRRSNVPAARRLAAQQLPQIPGARGLPTKDKQSEDQKRRAAFALARAAIADAYPGVRQESLRSLQIINYRDTVLFFVPALRSQSRLTRLRAATTLGKFPDRRAADALVETLDLAIPKSDGQALRSTQRDYISDFELVTTGTGFSVVELAGPVWSTAATGASAASAATEAP